MLEEGVFAHVSAGEDVSPGRAVGVILIAALTVVAAGCKTMAPTFADSEELQPDHGWLALSVTSPNPSISLLLTSGGKGYQTVPFPYGHHWEIMQLPAGDYKLTAFYAGSGNLRFDYTQPGMRDHFSFKIEPGNINYFGSLRLSGNSPQLYFDADDLARELEDRYPELVDLPRKFTHMSAYQD